MTSEQYFDIRKLHDGGLTIRAIARRLGIAARSATR
jgi:IS30 family transposase